MSATMTHRALGVAAFDRWMSSVDDLLTDRVGMSSEDLPDCGYAD